jgi:hypothetical protein
MKAAHTHETSTSRPATAAEPAGVGKRSLVDALPIQRKLDGAATTADPSGAARAGVAGAAVALPHGAAIQAAFGHHDTSSIRAYIGGPAATASHQLGAAAYATGDQIAFREPPDLRTAAHEAAHVVQQRRGGVAGGLGAAGDRHEAHADEVAERVVRGESAEALLDGGAPARGGASTAVQRMTRDPERNTTVSDGGGLLVVGSRTQLCYARAEIIAHANGQLEAAKARVRLATGEAYKDNPALFKVVPEVVDQDDMAKGVSDGTVHPVLKSLEPIHGETDEVRERKAAKYRAFWKHQDALLLKLSISISKYQNHMYVERLRREAGPRPAPGFTTHELRAHVEATTGKLSAEAGGYFGEFFHMLVTRNLLEEYDRVVGRSKDAAVSNEAADKHAIASRGKGSKDDGEVSEVEHVFAKDDLYKTQQEAGAHTEDVYAAAAFLREQLQKTQAQIGEEIESDGSTLIAPKRCSDMTRFVYGGQSLTDIPMDGAGGRVHHEETVAGSRLFHSAAVVIQDGDDMVTLETANGSGALPVGRNTWWFQMYGKTENTFQAQTSARWRDIA